MCSMLKMRLVSCTWRMASFHVLYKIGYGMSILIVIELVINHNDICLISGTAWGWGSGSLKIHQKAHGSWYLVTHTLFGRFNMGPSLDGSGDRWLFLLGRCLSESGWPPSNDDKIGELWEFLEEDESGWVDLSPEGEGEDSQEEPESLWPRGNFEAEGSPKRGPLLWCTTLRTHICSTSPGHSPGCSPTAR